MRLHDVEIDEAKLAAFCKKNGVTELLFFGSIVRSSFGPGSDIDVLVHLEAGAAPSLFDLGGIQQDLSSMFGRQVHLHTRGMLPPKYTDYFLRGALRAYAA